MKITKLNEFLFGDDDKSISFKGGFLTLKDVCVQSLLTPTQGEEEKAKLEKWDIYKKLRDAKNEVELTIDEASILKRSIGKIQPPLILGQSFEMLEEKIKR